MSALHVAVGALVGALLGYGGGRLVPRWLAQEEAREPEKDEVKEPIKPFRSWEPYGLAAVTGALAGLLAYSHPLDAYFWHQVLFLAVLTTASVPDLHAKIIPNELVLAGLGAGLILLFALPYPEKTWLQGLGGGAGAFALLLLIALVARGGMGEGDVKLAAVIGLFLGGWWGVMGLVFGFLAGGLVSGLLLLFRLVGRKDAIPFGPWLAIGAILTALYGSQIWAWYMGMYM
ncbi:MAG TPA: A24 family peptidase [Symbiobacteriaceae bacterium]|jgi:leader peptidase (prepilin peptidase)/N-methyltransferase|nr:A24 family peptidase [Symbiobacteriaceae bacterium]